MLSGACIDDTVSRMQVVNRFFHPVLQGRPFDHEYSEYPHADPDRFHPVASDELLLAGQMELFHSGVSIRSGFYNGLV